MKRVIIALIFFVVIITVNEQRLVPCPRQIPKPSKIADGIYEMPQGRGTTSILSLCTENDNRIEEWTDYPENGGVFIRRVGKTERGKP